MDSPFWSHAAQTIRVEYVQGGVTPVKLTFDTGWRTLPYHVVAQATEGEVLLEVDSLWNRTVRPRETMSIAPGVRHRISNLTDHGNISRWSHLNVWIFQTLPLAALFNLTGVVPQPQSDRLGEINAQLADIVLPGGLKASWTAHLRERFLELEIVTILVESLGATLPDSKNWRDLERLMPALKRIEENLGHSFSREELAAVVHLSPSHFAALFRTALGMAPGDYTRRRQLLKAQQLIATSSLGAEEIGRRCGFASPPHFSRAFKERFGHSPANYRRLRDTDTPPGF